MDNKSLKHILLAESGSTKTHFALIDVEHKQIINEWVGGGVNPVIMGVEELTMILTNEFQNLDAEQLIDLNIKWYGAGCTQTDAKQILETIIHVLLPTQTIDIYSDMFATTQALYDVNESGIAIILGTGSNVCYVNGGSVSFLSPSLGYILGDEGSGADIGKHIVKNMLYGNFFKESILQSFADEYNENHYDDIITGVYQSEKPNAYLASFSHFAFKHLDDPQINELIVSRFDALISGQLSKFIIAHPDAEIRASGSIAWHFNEQLKQSLEKHNLKLTKTIKSPIKALIANYVY
ncbi:MAG: hypothetical protein SGJ04_04135 [Bacteroidota bacterium]|nr:hypothetical protein [Bacteroidota bacterium]